MVGWSGRYYAGHGHAAYAGLPCAKDQLLRIIHTPPDCLLPNFSRLNTGSMFRLLTNWPSKLWPAPFFLTQPSWFLAYISVALPKFKQGALRPHNTSISIVKTSWPKCNMTSRPLHSSNRHMLASCPLLPSRRSVMPRPMCTPDRLLADQIGWRMCVTPDRKSRMSAIALTMTGSLTLGPRPMLLPLLIMRGEWTWDAWRAAVDSLQPVGGVTFAATPPPSD